MNEDDDQAAYRADLEQMRQEAIEALVHARQLGLSESECMAIAYPAGVATDFYKEIRK